MDLLINGQPRTFPDLSQGASVAELVTALDLKGDRVAIEHNGQIVSRPSWATTMLAVGDRMEIVHFVGGGADPQFCSCSRSIPGSMPGSIPGSIRGEAPEHTA